MGRIAEHAPDAARLDGSAGIHDGDALCVVCDHPQVMREDHEASFRLAAQSPEGRHHPVAHGGVERGGWLVGDDGDRLSRDGHRDHDSLRHPAGKLVGKAAHHALGVSKLDPREQVANAVPPPKSERDLSADTHGRIERCHGVLEDEAELLAT
jgi:hypothetical protein